MTVIIWFEQGWVSVTSSSGETILELEQQGEPDDIGGAAGHLSQLSGASREARVQLLARANQSLLFGDSAGTAGRLFSDSDEEGDSDEPFG